MPGEFLLATSLWVGENADDISVRAFLFNGHESCDSVRAALDSTTGPIPLRAVDLTLTLKEFVCLFKQFDVMLTWQDLPLEGREYDVIEE
ncbi:MAG: hypothetical protein ACYDCE_09635 [Candidatus Acidiferrales bacterium]